MLERFVTALNILCDVLQQSQFLGADDKLCLTLLVVHRGPTSHSFVLKYVQMLQSTVACKMLTICPAVSQRQEAAVGLLCVTTLHTRQYANNYSHHKCSIQMFYS